MEHYTLAEAAQNLGTSKQWLRAQCTDKGGTLKTFKIGKKIMVDSASLTEWVESRKS
jgi:hypothetical protein